MAHNFVSNSAAVGSLTATTLALEILVASCPTTGVSRVTITRPSWTRAHLAFQCYCSRVIPTGGNHLGCRNRYDWVIGVLRDTLDAIFVLHDDAVHHTIVPVTLQTIVVLRYLLPNGSQFSQMNFTRFPNEIKLIFWGYIKLLNSNIIILIRQFRCIGWIKMPSAFYVLIKQPKVVKNA